MKQRLPTPELHVIMRDGAEHTVQAFNADLVAWDRDRSKHKWPLPQEAPFMWLEYLAWHVLTKTQGILPAQSLREFGDKVASIVSVNNDDKDDEDVPGVDPTSLDPEVE